MKSTPVCQLCQRKLDAECLKCQKGSTFSKFTYAGVSLSELSQGELNCLTLYIFLKLLPKEQHETD